MGFTSHALDFPNYLVDSSRNERGDNIVLAPGQVTDYPDVGGTRACPGMVFVKESGDGLYYLADGADGVNAGDINTSAIVTSKEKPDADWDSKTLTWRVVYPSGEVARGTVLGAAADDTIAEWVTLLKADQKFAAHIVPSDAGASDLLVLTTIAQGNVKLYVSMDLDTAFATDDGATSSDSDSGVEADARVITQHRDLVDLDGANEDVFPVENLRCGNFYEDNLLHLSDEAKGVILGRGGRFE